MARTAKPEHEKNVQISAVITPDEHKALQEIRWTTRAERLTEVFADAIREYIDNHATVTSEGTDSK